ncbi:MAG TPA: hypothetical protein VEI73_17270 [Candidatus Acidoferrum sp.]|nr:hypothetical protein [Candidatus Acidoferrum sp.]
MRNWLQSWLDREDAIAKVDLIFVLASLQSRKEYALALFQKGCAPQVLFSVGRFEIRRFSQLGLPGAPDLVAIARGIPSPERHFFVFFRNGQFEVKRIPRRRLGTLSEIDALADWIALHPEISSLALVSSGQHLFRVRLCCRSLLSSKLKTYFLEVPNESSAPSESDPEEPRTGQQGVFYEFLKITCYAAFLPVWSVLRRWRSRTMASLNQ